jgi:hypothetical protein
VERFVIYGLTEPNGGELRYIGKSTTGAASRLASHLCPSSLRGRTHKERWVKSLLARGESPEVFVIEAHESKEALNEAERHHIAYFRSVGCHLTNLTPGGDGLGVPCTPERRAKISATQLGKPKPPWSAERRARPNPNIGNKRSAEAIEKTATARRGLKHTPDARAKMGAASSAQWASAEARIAQSRRRGGRPIVDHLGRRYETQREAARLLGLNVSHLNQVLKGRRRHTNGFTFTYGDL